MSDGSLDADGTPSIHQVDLFEDVPRAHRRLFSDALLDPVHTSPIPETSEADPESAVGVICSKSIRIADSTFRAITPALPSFPPH